MTISRTVKKIRAHLKKNPDLIAASAICFIFLAAFLTLSLVKHAHFGTGYDLSIDSQIIWEFSRFKMPISTTHVYAFTPFYYDHIELVYFLLANRLDFIEGLDNMEKVGKIKLVKQFDSTKIYKINY